MVEIDGAFGEGGGQILRSSLTLAALTGQALEIHNIRANRSQPGLRAQHLAAVNAITKVTQTSVEGASLGSTHIFLKPQTLKSGTYQFDISTAGALTLLLQTVFLPLSFADGRSQLTLTGGTHVRWSPIWHYLQASWLPMMSQLGFRSSCELTKAGFFPRGGGKVSVNILPVNLLQPMNCTARGALLRIRGFSGVSNLDDAIAKRQKHQALRRLYEVCRDSKIKTLRLPSPGKGTFILLKVEFSNGGCACFSALGAPGKPAEHVADEAADQLLSFLSTDGCVDHYLADQLLLPLALITETSSFRTNCLSDHLLTNAHVIKQFLPVSIQIEGQRNQPALVHIKGVRL